ncbi:MAG TPA: ATPase domain-containing protein, partial [Gemmatimonadaceae bacterium]|nr:ATPase domain-containing protein [Gemmatimonadaceae bacterium]
MAANKHHDGIEKVATGIPGFDIVAQGGLPRARATLVAGTAGSGKTVFVTNFLAAGIEHFGEGAVLITFEDSPADIRQNMLSFGWDIAQWEKEGRFAFVDVSPEPANEATVVGSFDLGGLLSRIEHAVRKTKACRVALDSLNALFVQFPDRALMRGELFRITTALKRLGITVLFTAERVEDYGSLTQFGVEEF